MQGTLSKEHATCRLSTTVSILTSSKEQKRTLVESNHQITASTKPAHKSDPTTILQPQQNQSKLEGNSNPANKDNAKPAHKSDHLTTLTLAKPQRQQNQSKPVGISNPANKDNVKPANKSDKTCHHCGKVYSFRSGLSKHIREKHNKASEDQPKGYIVCHLCKLR